MKALVPRLLILLAVGIIATNVLAEEHPAHERGMRPGLAYRLEGIDQVNMFNGNVSLTIPLGSTYPVGGTLSYSLVAHYSTNAWESMTHEQDIEGAPFESRVYTYWYPSEHANAGFGWIVSLGRLDTTQHPEDGTDAFVYIAPDGSKHGFKPTLHQNNPDEEADPNVEYTRDGTYLRLRHLSSGYAVDFSNGHVHTFDALGLLTKIEDPFENFVKIEYTTQADPDLDDPPSTHPESTVWRITDSVGREQRVYFRPGWTYFEERHLTDMQPVPKPHEIVEKVELEAFDGTTAEYKFYYNVLPEELNSSNEHSIALKTSRRCTNGVQDPQVPQFVRVSLLSALGMPHNLEYGMVTDRGNQTDCSTTLFGGYSGNITKLTLPTEGFIDWTYRVYSFPTLGRPTHNAGVATRTATAYGATAPTATTIYQSGSVSYELGADKYRMVINKDGANTVLNATKHYFASCPKASWCGSAADYGLPYRRSDHLSTEFFIPDASGTLVSKRKTYVRYEADTLTLSDPEWRNRNQRPVWQKTVYEDDKFEEVTYSDFDGLGHYRKAVTDGNFESGNDRTTFTRYNPTVATFELNANGTLRYEYSLPTGPWLLTTFDQQWVAEPNHAGDEIYSRTSVCFDPQGFMTSRRTHKNLVEAENLNFGHDGGDLLAVFERDDFGNLRTERYFGGDLSPAPDESCGDSYDNDDEDYRIDHTYAYGVEESSYYVDGDDEMSFYISDNVIDKTGLIEETRHSRTFGGSDGLSTFFDYDLLGRLTEAKGTRRKTTYSYSAQPARVVATEQALPVPPQTLTPTVKTSTSDFDDFGRLVKETKSIPGGTSTRTTTYNGLGWKTTATDWGAAAPTVFGYDGFGRVTSVQPADSKIAPTTITYTGVAQVERTTMVRTGGSGTDMTLTPSVTTEDYDRQGRLIRVTEPPPIVGGTRPKTDYRYDVGGRMTRVCANVNAQGACGQTRTFTYDNRGFLSSEVHPENGTTHYVSYDARGHLRRRYLGSQFQFDVEFEYDPAERLSAVHQRLSQSDTRPLKEFFYADANDGSDRKNGQLFEAVRHNWISIPAATPIPYNVQVIETYAYTDRDGNVSSRVTTDYPCPVSATQNCESLRPVAANRSFSQEFKSEELDQQQNLLTSSLVYPKCATGSVCGSLPSRTVTNTYSNDMLTKVVTADAGSASLTYYPSGLTDVVSHGNFVNDKQHVDPLMPGRPQEIVTSGVIEVLPCVEPSFSLQPQSQTIQSGSVTLTATATGQDNLPITYQWYHGTAPDTSDAISSSTVTPATTSNYWVKASNSCGWTASATATITICNAARISVPQPDITITRGETRTLEIAVTGSPAPTYQWYTVAPDGTPTLIPGAVSPALTVSPSQRVWFRVMVSNACDVDTDDVVVDVAEPPTTPSSVVATYNAGTNRIAVSWAQSHSTVGISHYNIKRQPGGLTFTVVPPAPLSYTDQTLLSSGAAYIYSVIAVDVNGVASAESLPDVASVRTFTNDPLPASGAEVRAVHMSELRLAIDAVRLLAGLPAAWSQYLPPPRTMIHAVDFVQLRDRLNEARDALNLPTVELIAPVVDGELMYRSVLTQLRDGVK